MTGEKQSADIDDMAVSDSGRRWMFGVLAAIVLAWSSMLYFVTPTQLISLLGVENSYVLIFVACVIGGTSILVPFPYQVVVLTMGAAGLPPLYVGLVAGVGVSIGDSVSYILAYQGRAIIPGWMVEHVKDLHAWLVEQYHWFLDGLFFVYAAVIPLSNDLVMVPTGLARYPFWRVIAPMMAGGIVFNTILAALGLYGYTFFF